MADEPILKAKRELFRAAGKRAWHVLASEQGQFLSVHPMYAADERPLDGNVTIHVVHYDDDGALSEVDMCLPVAQMTRLCRQFLSVVDADTVDYHAAHASELEEEEEEAEEDEEEEEEEEDDDAESAQED